MSTLTTVGRNSNNIKTMGNSIRCVQDSAASPAGTGGNVTGYAYSAGTGWIKFSSSTPPVGKREPLESDPKFAERIERALVTAERAYQMAKLRLFGIPNRQSVARRDYSSAVTKAIGFSGTLLSKIYDAVYFGVKTALAASDYSVNIDPTTGQFSGYAWSDAVGWIYFGPDANLPGYGQTNEIDAPSSPKYWAKWSKAFDAPDSVTGWAKILALGADGWIKMSDAGIGTWAGRGVSIKTGGDFDGWAWNSGAGGAAGIGWIAFNATACSLPGVTCPGGATGYKVVANLGVGPNQPPTAVNLSAPNHSTSSAQLIGAKHAYLSWVFSDPNNICAGGSNNGNACIQNSDCPGGSCNIVDTQSAYRVILYNLTDSNIATDTSQVISTAVQFDASAWIDYGKTYRWELYVWDSNGASSTVVNSPVDFTTFTHEFPNAYFGWAPAKPSAGQTVIFDSGRSTTTWPVYLPFTYAWTFTNTDISTSASSSPTAKIVSSGTSTKIQLIVTDSAGYSSAPTSTSFSGKLKLPSWTEVKP